MADNPIAVNLNRFRKKKKSPVILENNNNNSWADVAASNAIIDSTRSYRSTIRVES